MEDDPEISRRRERLRRLLREVEALLSQTDATLDAMTAEAPAPASVGQLARLRTKLMERVQDYLDENAALAGHFWETKRKIEEANRRTAMSEQRSNQARNQARIQAVSEELTRDLRLERIDRAIKELLDFLADAEFFAANASTGRRRRLRVLQSAIAKMLQT